MGHEEQTLEISRRDGRFRITSDIQRCSKFYYLPGERASSTIITTGITNSNAGEDSAIE
jgi:hypothetical protein